MSSFLRILAHSAGDLVSYAAAPAAQTEDAYFDAAFYLAQNPDVAAAHVDPLLHYQTIGWTEGRDPSAAFSTRQYLVANPDVAAAHIDPLAHFVASGQAEGRLPRNDVDFDATYYLAHNPDVAAAGVDPFQHYLASGAAEGRNPNAFFDTNYYLQHNPAVAASGINPLIHFETFGWKAGLNPSAAFDTHAYLAANPDVAASKIDPLSHFLHTGLAEGRAANPAADFDATFYLAGNPDVAASGMDPYVHYLTFGWHEGRDPNAFFNTRYYLANNPDVAAAGVNPLLHYETSGWHEGRDPSAGFSTSHYLQAYPDVAAAGIDPLTHYLAFGIREGRIPSALPGTAPTVGLAAAFRLAAPNTTASPLVELVGHADPGAAVRLGTSTTTADAAGTFRFTALPLALGVNTFTATAVDAQGRTGVTSLSFTRVADSGGTSVSDWNQQMLDAIASVGTDPEFSSRAMALEGIAVLDVVNAIQGKAGFLVSLAAPAGIAMAPAVAAAARDMLAYLFPSRTSVFDAALSRSLAGLPTGTATDAAVAFGKSIAAAVIAIRDPDGWNRIVIDEGSSTPGQWRPTAPDFGLAQEPQWGSVTPFTLTSGAEFRLAGPPAIGSAAYLAGLDQVKSLGSLTSTTRTADQTQIAKFWADGAGTMTPAGHWNMIARSVMATMGLDAATQARVLAEVDIALADSAIAGWDTKFTYDTERPITAIRTGDTGGTADAAWTPLIKTPPHPSYVSGHSTFSAAAAAVLDSIFGTVAFSIGSPSLANVTRSFASFDAAEAEAAVSRVYAGVHFTWDVTDGNILGAEVGQTVVSAFDNARDTGPRSCSTSAVPRRVRSR